MNNNNNLLDSIIENLSTAKAAWCRFITANDAGVTGGHQAGFYVPKCASAILFNTPGRKGENKEKDVNIKWQNDFSTNSCMKYYGKGTRNEYRITRFGKDFPFLQEDYIGSLLILAKHTERDYVGFVLDKDEEMDTFFATFNLSPDKTNQLIDLTSLSRPNQKLLAKFQQFINPFSNFPETKTMAQGARDCYNQTYHIKEKDFIEKPDAILLKWIDTEYSLFKYMEEKFYKQITTTPFASISDFIKTANEVLNRRKSRAGKSLENHLSNLFEYNNLIFESQAITEDNKKPDFLFPNGECYHNLKFLAEDLIMLGVKTTCKDRWRQVVTEADRITNKHLFTLQQGISKNQLKEMEDSHLSLVVPATYISSFPIEYQDKIYTLSKFILYVKEKQTHLPKYYTL